MTHPQSYHDIPELFLKLRSRVEESSRVVQLIPHKLKVQLDYFLSSINNCINVLQQQTLFIINTNKDLQQHRQQSNSKAQELEQKYLNIKIQHTKDINQMQSKNYKLTKEVEFLNFVIKGLKQEINQSKILVKNVKEAGIKQVNNIIKDVQSDIRKSAEKICYKINSYREGHQTVTLNTEQEDLKVDLKFQKQKQRQESQIASLQVTQVKKSKKVESKLSKILQQQAQRAQMQQKDYYIQTNQF